MKKILAYFTASVLALASLPYSAGAAEFDPFPPGDVDQDTVITGHDAAMVSRHILRGDNRLTDKQLKQADINRDGVVDQTDADLIHQQAVENGYRLGDANLDGNIWIEDAFQITQANAQNAAFLRGDITAPWMPFFSKLQINLADMTGFPYLEVSLDDAMTVLQYYSYLAAGYDFGISPYERDVFRNADGQRCYYAEAAAAGIPVYAVRNVEELIAHLEQETPLPPQPETDTSPVSADQQLDFADVKGQQNARYALEIAAAGGHNALMIGSPGSGKSMLAKRIPSILPEMTRAESMETTQIYSIAGLLDPKQPLIRTRPFRSPHHTISSVGLVGGGSVPHPGEISLAHNGLLFLDELAEFDHRTLEIMRQPLEDHRVTITRAAGTITYPCSFMLVGAMNPCPCGYFGHPHRKCTCSDRQVRQYLNRISGPLLDRFDLHIEVEPVSFDDLSAKTKSESSAEIRKRVQAARERQTRRFAGTNIFCNAAIPAGKLQDYCTLDSDALTLLHAVFDKLGLSARAYDRILKVARTIADLDQCDVIGKKHIASAAQFRSLDRKYWAQ